MANKFFTSFLGKKNKNNKAEKAESAESGVAEEVTSSAQPEKSKPESDKVVTDSQNDSSVKEKKPNKKKKKKKKKKKNRWLSLLIKLGIIAAVLFLCSFFVEIEFVHSNSMFPSMRDGDLVITTNLLNYTFNDVVVYKTHESTGETEKHMGRIMCLENNEVELDDYNNFKVNGNIITSNEFYKDYEKGSLKYPYFIEPDHFFILQDYRMEVDDSRIYGAIDKKDITGKVIFVFRIRGF